MARVVHTSIGKRLTRTEYEQDSSHTVGGVENITVIAASATSTNNAIARWDGGDGDTLQNSGIIIDDSNNLAMTGTLTLTGSLVVAGTSAKGIEIGSTNSTAQLYIGGTAILASGEQAIYINCPLETVATNGAWITLASTVTSGDLSGIRTRVYGNAASSGANIRGGYLEAKMKAASKYAAMLEGALMHADYSAGNITVSGDVRGFTAHISQGTGLNAANLYGGLINIQTRGNETITTDDMGLKIRNEAVGGNGRQMDAAIAVVEATMGGGTKGFGIGIDLSGATYATSAIKLGGSIDANQQTITAVRQVVEAHTAADTLTLAESGSLHTNLGASGTVALTLPASATAGVWFEFGVQVAQQLRVVVGAAGEKLYHNGTISTDDSGADLYVMATDEGDSTKVISDGAGGWITLYANPIGDWGVTQP